MHIQLLPDHVTLEILRYLPLKEKIRIGSVNQNFLNLSYNVVSEIKSIDLEEPIFKNLDIDSFSKLTDLCSNQLQKIQFLHQALFVHEFSKYSWPRLTDLSLGGITIENDTFRDLLQNAPNLKRLSWYSLRPIFPKVRCENLERILIFHCQDDFFRSFAGQCPNLTHLQIFDVDHVTAEAADALFEKCPKLESIIFGGVRRLTFRFESLTWFWKLKSLRTLALYMNTNCRMNGTGLEKIASSFPQLTDLYLLGVDVTDRGIALLSCLKQLRKLSLEWNVMENDIDQGIRRLAECGRLEYAQFGCHVTPDTLRALVGCCPELEYLKVDSIEGIASIESAIETLEALKTSRGRKITLRMGDFNHYKLWKTKEVVEFSKELEANGDFINIEYGGIKPYC